LCPICRSAIAYESADSLSCFTTPHKPKKRKKAKKTKQKGSSVTTIEKPDRSMTACFHDQPRDLVFTAVRDSTTTWPTRGAACSAEDRARARRKVCRAVTTVCHAWIRLSWKGFTGGPTEIVYARVAAPSKGDPVRAAGLHRAWDAPGGWCASVPATKS
jgi:hypothetical protein